jgi:hypothetical protein
LKVVEAERSGRPATWMAGRPSIFYAEDSTTHSTCSSPLVKVRSSSSAGEVVAQVKPGQELS